MVYYTLAEWLGGKWHPQFGSYSRKECEQELQCYRYSTAGMLKRNHYRIVKSGDAQTDIDMALAKLKAPK